MERVYRGTMNHCAGCGHPDSHLTELMGGSNFRVCYNCLDEYMEFMRKLPLYKEFETVHESYIVAKRVASRSFKLTDVGKRLDLAKSKGWGETIGRMFEMRMKMASVTRGWFRMQQAVNNVKESLDEED